MLYMNIIYIFIVDVLEKIRLCEFFIFIDVIIVSYLFCCVLLVNVFV